MIAVLDACVLFPTVMRAMVLGAAKAGHFDPKWSVRLLEEWARVARRMGPEHEAIARGEIALAGAHWPEALVETAPELAGQIWLPDRDDVHVLATAISSGASVILTLNLRDFPSATLSEFGVTARHPDEFLRSLYQTDPESITAIATSVHAEAERLSGQDWDMRKLMKKARLPRLGKALSGA